METIKEAWTGILNYLQNQNDISEVAFNVWISCIEPYTIEDGNVVVFVQTSFQRKIINEHYQNKLCEAFNHVLGLPLGLKILSRDELSAADSPAAEECGDPGNLFGQKSSDYEYSFENFIVYNQLFQSFNLLQRKRNLFWILRKGIVESKNKSSSFFIDIIEINIMPTITFLKMQTL